MEELGGGACRAPHEGMRSSARPPSVLPPVVAVGDPDVRSSVSVDFVNTVACEACRTSDGLASARTFVRWNRAHRALARISTSPDILDDLRALRQDLCAMFETQTLGRSPGPSLLRRLNRWFGTSPAYLRASFSKGRWSLEEEPGIAGPAQRWEFEMARAATSLLAGPLSPKLRKCQAPGCAHFLLSRKRGQLWCSPTGCGNRVRVARHYRKRRGKAREGRATGDRSPSPR